MAVTDVDEAVCVDPQPLRSFVALVLEDLGFRADDAAATAETLVRTDLRGHHSHGVRFLLTYVPQIRGGAISPAACPRVTRESDTTALIDGDSGMGHVVMRLAVRHAIEKVGAGCGCATVLARNSNHFGAGDPYALMIAEAGLIGIVMTNSVPCMSAPGSQTSVISNTPFAYAIPAPEGRHVVLDMALSATAGSYVRMAFERGESIPEGWVHDGEGRPTTDPAAMFNGGSLVPVGGHKGWALAVLVESLAGVASGAGVLSQVMMDQAKPGNTGHVAIVVDPEAFLARDEFDARVLAMIDEIHDAPREAGATGILVPGELELEHERDALANGLELDAFTWSSLAGFANDAGRSAELERARL